MHRATVRALGCAAGLPPRKAPAHPRHVRDQAVALDASGLWLLKVGSRSGSASAWCVLAGAASSGFDGWAPSSRTLASSVGFLRYCYRT